MDINSTTATTASYAEFGRTAPAAHYAPLLLILVAALFVI